MSNFRYGMMYRCTHDADLLVDGGTLECICTQMLQDGNIVGFKQTLLDYTKDFPLLNLHHFNNTICGRDEMIEYASLTGRSWDDYCEAIKILCDIAHVPISVKKGNQRYLYRDNSIETASEKLMVARHLDELKALKKNVSFIPDTLIQELEKCISSSPYLSHKKSSSPAITIIAETSLDKATEEPEYLPTITNVADESLDKTAEDSKPLSFKTNKELLAKMSSDEVVNAIAIILNKTGNSINDAFFTEMKSWLEQ